MSFAEVSRDMVIFRHESDSRSLSVARLNGVDGLTELTARDTFPIPEESRGDGPALT